MTEPKRAAVYLFDLDGTLANVSHRDPYDASQCDADPAHEPVLQVAKALQAQGFGIVCTSGRQECHRRQTHAFLVWHGVEYLRLLMRNDGDPRPDHVVKAELYRNHIAGRFDVLGVFDDRDSVCDLWRWLGLTCFQVTHANGLAP